jgi:hypothetical protein
VSTAQRSTFDRGFDLGNAEVPPAHSPVLGRGLEPKAKTSMPLKKMIAMSMVLIMVASAFVMLAPIVNPHALAPVADEPAKSQAGVRTVDYNISHLGEVYLKDSRDVDGARGVSGSTMGLSDWWNVRRLNYSDTIVHNSYPYTIAYQTESASNSYIGGKSTGANLNPPLYHLPFGHYSFYRFAFDAKNLVQNNLATGPNRDPLYIPVLGKLTDDGGNVQLNWHITYMLSSDVADMQLGTSYINTYYGVPTNAVNFNANPNDGWYIEHSGKMVFDRNAAKKFLNLGLTTDLRIQFAANNTAINNAWALHYITDGNGGVGSLYDIMACYDSHVNSGPVLYWLTLNGAENQNPDVLTVRIWGISWGFEYLLMRYLDVQGLITKFQPSIEDWYFNATIGSGTADVQSRTTAVYHMQTWKDANSWIPSWLIEPQHDDYNPYIGAYLYSWESRFLNYYSFGPITKTTDYRPTVINWMPGSNGTEGPGMPVAYWQTPTWWNLVLGETLTVKLPTGPFLGFEVYTGTVSDIFPGKGGGNNLKAFELLNHTVWGELVLGHGFPSTVYDSAYYDHTTKTLSFAGPTSWDQNVNPYVPPPGSGVPPGTVLNWTGSPQLMLDVSRVSNYSLAMQEAGPYATGTQYHLIVTAKNYTGVTQTTWNGTVDLVASAGVTLGSLQHTFIVGDGGVWTTTISFSSTGSKTVTSKDSALPLDIVDALAVDVGAPIPEFPSVLVPVMMGAAMIVVFIRRRPKKDEE